MIKFILYDDHVETFQRTSNIINKSIVNYNCNYRIEKYSKYDKDLEKTITSGGCQKIYLLDVEVPKVNGISLAAKIRKKDWNSIIIFLSSYEKYRMSAFAERLMILDYVCKVGDYQKRLDETIKIAMDAINKNNNNLTYKFNSITHHIPIHDILYIVKVPANKKCIIHTINGSKYEIGGSVTKLSNNLKDNFKQSHKSCIVNIDNIKTVDSVNNIITFKNGKSTNLLSNRMRRNFEKSILKQNNKE